MKVVLFNVSDGIAKSFLKYGIRNDTSTESLNLDHFLSKAANMVCVVSEVCMYVVRPVYYFII